MKNTVWTTQAVCLLGLVVLSGCMTSPPLITWHLHTLASPPACADARDLMEPAPVRLFRVEHGAAFFRPSKKNQQAAHLFRGEQRPATGAGNLPP